MGSVGDLKAYTGSKEKVYVYPGPCGWLLIDSNRHVQTALDNRGLNDFIQANLDLMEFVLMPGIAPTTGEW